MHFVTSALCYIIGRGFVAFVFLNLYCRIDFSKGFVIFSSLAVYLMNCVTSTIIKISFTVIILYLFQIHICHNSVTSTLELFF